ncbi:MAG: 3-dehydroquinate synthase [Saprospiraceae bacterium]|jgi:3-dehydroquinate synthase
MQTISLQDYKIHVGDFRQSLRNILTERQYTKVAVLVDENTRTHCLPAVMEVLADFSHFIIEIPSGELNKNIQTCTQIWTQMMENNADRHSLTINLGGGVIGDMGGFCASTFKRGMDFLQMPTTLLSQVDASIGGKLGVDFNHIKNSVGVFNNPQMVLIDPQFLTTLSQREIRSGFGEIIKHSLVADKSQWDTLLKIEDLSKVDWTDYLVPSLKIKQTIVEEDPFEKGIRKALNFGHTIGHAIESMALETDNPLLHGEAIAAGMICESYLSCQKVGLRQEEFEKIKTFITRIYQPREISEKDFPELIRLMSKDKKNEGFAINFTLLTGIGSCKINETATAAEIEESMK